MYIICWKVGCRNDDLWMAFGLSDKHHQEFFQLMRWLEEPNLCIYGFQIQAFRQEIRKIASTQVSSYQTTLEQYNLEKY